MSPHQTPRPEQPNFFRPRYYSKEQTEQEAPSVKAGMSLKKMATQRRQYVQLIIGVCKDSKLGQFIACSAITFCHHFYLARVRSCCCRACSTQWHVVTRLGAGYAASNAAAASHAPRLPLAAAICLVLPLGRRPCSRMTHFW